MTDEIAPGRCSDVVGVDGYPANIVPATIVTVKWALAEVVCGGRAVHAHSALTPGLPL